jgi:ankyrin repeat protein
MKTTRAAFAVGLFGLASLYTAAHATAPLADALEAGNGSEAAALLSEGADPNAVQANGTSALMWAVFHGDVVSARRLIENGADVNLVNDFGATALAEAAVLANRDVLELLLDAGADVNAANADGQTALMVVARSSSVDAARLLLDRGADVNAAEGRKGQTALMWASAQRQPEMVRVLIEHGAIVDAVSPTHEWDRRVTAEPRMKNLPSGGWTALLFAAREGCLPCAQALLTAGADIERADPDGITPLLMAILNAHFDLAATLIESGANIRRWDIWGRTPLYAAVDFNTLPHGGRPDRLSLDETTSIALVERLLDRGANPNAQLKLFPPYRSLRMDRGADVTLEIGATPLLRAARGSDLEAIDLLLAHGALVDLPQRSGVTPLMAAVGYGWTAIDTRGRFVTEQDALATADRLIEAGADVRARDNGGRTALHAAAAKAYLSVIERLVAAGADVRAADVDGMTPIDAANGRVRALGRGAAGNANPEAVALLEALAER